METADIRATDTVSVERPARRSRPYGGDGADVIATTGSFGECHTLLRMNSGRWRMKAPARCGGACRCSSASRPVNARETAAKMRVVAETAADGVLLGVPYYFLVDVGQRRAFSFTSSPSCSRSSTSSSITIRPCIM